LSRSTDDHASDLAIYRPPLTLVVRLARNFPPDRPPRVWAGGWGPSGLLLILLLALRDFPRKRAS